MNTEGYDPTRIRLFSPEQVLGWSFGEVTRPDTINSRILKPVRDGLFCERIFGPTKDYQCSCGKYEDQRYKGIICDCCGVQLALSSVRRERMGHIQLATPVAHPRFVKGSPSPMALLLDISQRDLERIINFSQYIIISVDEEHRHQTAKTLEAETRQKVEKVPAETERMCLQSELQRRMKDMETIRPLAVITESRYRQLSEHYDFFKAGTGAEALLEILKNLDLERLKAQVIQEAGSASGQRSEAVNERFIAIDQLQRSGARPEWMILTVLPVLPPDLRPLVQLEDGRSISRDLNDLYRGVINRNNRLRVFRQQGAPEMLIHKEKALIQKGVDALMSSEQFWSLLKKVLRPAGEGRKIEDRPESQPSVETTALLRTLSSRQRKVLSLLYGPEDGRSRTVEEVARQLGVSQKRIRPAEAKALRRLRDPSRSQFLKHFIGLKDEELRRMVREFLKPKNDG